MHHQGNTVLFYGPPGTGKTIGAEAIAFATGKPLKVVNTGELVISRDLVLMFEVVKMGW